MSTLLFANTLDFSVIVYDSFDNGSTGSSTGSSTGNYFGTLTQLATVPAKSTKPVQLIHTPLSVLIVSDATTNAPLARLISSPFARTNPFGVGPADVEAMSQTMAFIAFITQNPNDPLATAFQALFKDSSQPALQTVPLFFAQHPTYSKCTLATYMMGIIYAAEQSASKGKPLDQALYSLSTLVTLLGGTWPAGFPDIVVSNFSCDTANNALDIGVEIDLDGLPAQSDQALHFFGSLFDVKQLQVRVYFNYSFGLNLFGTRLSIGLNAVNVPFGGSTSLTINNPTATIDINPLFKFTVLTVTGSVPFNIFGKAFETDVSMVVDNLEANCGVVIKGDNTSLSGPPVMQGVHFDEYGVGMGVFFEPPGSAIGLSGQFHLGSPASGTQIALDDNTFAVVCQLVEEVPNPLYISFYVPQMQLTDVVTLFTNTQTTLDVPVSFVDLSFKWSENPMEPVALPDGSLSTMGYGFSASTNILAFSFYGDIEIDLSNGLAAEIDMNPLALGPIFSLGGNGKGVTINVDANGNPIKNNQLPTTAAQEQALKTTSTKQLVVPGGPTLQLQTFPSPLLHVNGYVSLFEVDNAALDADITTTGINFEVDFGELLNTKMYCTLVDLNNLSAQFSFGMDQNISLGSLAGVSLGSMQLQAWVSAHFTLSMSSSGLIVSVGGGFDFAGLTRNFGDSTVDANIQTVSDLLTAIGNYIEESASSVFSDLLSTGGAWAAMVQQGVIQTANSVAEVLANAYGETADEIAVDMRQLEYGVDEITGELKDVFNPSQVASTLAGVFGQSANQVASTMEQAGYTSVEVAGALKDTFGSDIGIIANALQDAFGMSADDISNTLGQIGFSQSDIGNAFQSLGGDFASVGDSIMNGLSGLGGDLSGLGNDLNPFNW